MVPPEISRPDVLKGVDDLIRSSFEAFRNSCFSWLLVSTGVVVAGLLLELPEIYLESINAIRQVLHSDEAERHVPAWVKLVVSVGWFLIVLGVAGEFVADSFVSRADGFVQTFDEILLADAQREAAFSLERAANNERESAQLHADLETAKGETKAAETKLEKEQQKTAGAQKEAADSQLELKKYVTKVAERQRARGVDSVKLLAMLKGKPKSSIMLLYNPNDSEAYWLAFMLYTWLGKGNPDAGAGWDVSPPRPIPPNMGNRGGHPADAPPAMHFGGIFTGFGITFVVNDATLRQELQIGSPFQSFTAAIMSSITPRQSQTGYSFISDGDNNIPDGVILVVVGPKPPVMFPDELKLEPSKQ